MAQWWSWQSREVLLIILVFMVVLALWNTTEKMTMGKMWSKTRYTPQPVGVARDTDNYTLQIATYLEGRRKGLTQDQIATDIFKVDFPNHGGCPHSYPFVTGDTFRAFADVVFDNAEHYPSIAADFLGGKHLTMDGEVLFINSAFITDFEMGPLANITTRFILITHNSDYPAPGYSPDQHLLKHPLLIRWFAQNIDPEYRDHRKMEAIPIGLPNQCMQLYQLADIEPYIQIAPPAYSPLQESGMGHHEGQEDYFEQMTRSKFTLSPPGIGEDCHRTWEAVLLGSIPIVRHSGIDSLFQDSPIFVLDEWNITYKTPEKFLGFSPPNLSKKHAMAQYWFDRINAWRDK